MSSVEAYKEGLKNFRYDAEAVDAMAPRTQEQLEADLVQAVKNGANKGVNLTTEEDKPVDKAELKNRIIEKIGSSPSRQRARYTPDYTLTDEYKRMVEAGESTIVYQKFGSYTDKRRQEEIDHSLEIPLSESIKLRDSLEAEIYKLEADMDNFSTKEAQDRVDQITQEYKVKARGKGTNARATLQAEYEKECNEAEMELYIKPRNLLAVKRAEAIERYKVYENRVKLYVDANREAIEKRLIEARNREIDENLLALAEYVEG